MIQLTIEEIPRDQLGKVVAQITEEARQAIIDLLKAGQPNPKPLKPVKVPVFLGTLPLGARFTYSNEPDAKVWVLLDRGRTGGPGGRVAEADPLSARLQSVCRAVEPTEIIHNYEVWVERAK